MTPEYINDWNPEHITPADQQLQPLQPLEGTTFQPGDPGYTTPETSAPPTLPSDDTEYFARENELDKLEGSITQRGWLLRGALHVSGAGLILADVAKVGDEVGIRQPSLSVIGAGVIATVAWTDWRAKRNSTDQDS